LPLVTSRFFFEVISPVTCRIISAPKIAAGNIQTKPRELEIKRKKRYRGSKKEIKVTTSIVIGTRNGQKPSRVKPQWSNQRRWALHLFCRHRSTELSCPTETFSLPLSHFLINYLIRHPLPFLLPFLLFLLFLWLSPAFFFFFSNLPPQHSLLTSTSSPVEHFCFSPFYFLSPFSPRIPTLDQTPRRHHEHDTESEELYPPW
jgi:hypothetical protein